MATKPKTKNPTKAPANPRGRPPLFVDSAKIQATPAGIKAAKDAKPGTFLAAAIKAFSRPVSLAAGMVRIESTWKPRTGATAPKIRAGINELVKAKVLHAL